ELDHAARPGLDDRHRNDPVRVVEDLSHAELAAQDPFVCHVHSGGSVRLTRTLRSGTKTPGPAERRFGCAAWFLPGNPVEGLRGRGWGVAGGPRRRAAALSGDSWSGDRTKTVSPESGTMLATALRRRHPCLECVFERQDRFPPGRHDDSTRLVRGHPRIHL